jgi:2-keto-myo-inositol isomerase
MKPCISQATTLTSRFEDDISAYTAGGFTAMEVWLTKLEQHLETQSPAELRKMLQDQGITLAAAAYQGGLLLSQGEQRRVHYDAFRKRLDLCQFFAIPTLLLAPDFAERADAGTLGRAIESLAEAARWAGGANVRLALEFRGSDRFCSSLPTALALATQSGEPNVGVNLDVFHYYTGPSKFEDLALLTPETLAHVQVSDLAGVPRELAGDAQRILPGDGDFQLEAIIAQLRAIGYEGWVSLELMNPTLWQVDATQVAGVGFSALERLLGMISE